MVKIRGPVIPGMRVLREAPASGRWPKQFRWYNPDGEPFEIEAEELSTWLQLRLRDGEVEIVPDKAPAQVVAKKKEIDR